MIGKLFIAGAIISFLIFTYFFLNVKWILPLAIALFILYIAIRILLRILRRRKSGGSASEETDRYFGGLFTDCATKFGGLFTNFATNYDWWSNMLMKKVQLMSEAKRWFS
jgi:hypothetical protein